MVDVAEVKGLVGGPFGSNLVSRDYVPGGIPVIRGTNLGHGRRVGGEYVYVSEAKFERDLHRNSAVEHDLIFTQRGTLGQVAIVHGKGKFVVSQSQMRLRVDRSIADPLYVYYACSEANFLRQIDAAAIRTGVPHINLGILGELTVPLPNLATQTAIAEVLGALDDKIAANKRVLECNVSLRRAIFDSLDKPLSVPMSELARFVNGRNFTKGATGNGRPVIRIAELNNGVTGSTVWNDVKATEDNVARAGDVLFAWSGSLTVTRWNGVEGLVNQHIFKVLPKGLHDWVTFHLLLEKLADYKAIAADKATTMGHIQRGHLDEPVATPTSEEVARVDGRMSALWTAELHLRIENARLAATRDALLPELVSGRLAVSDALGSGA